MTILDKPQTPLTTEWTLDGFVEHFDFVHHRMLDHKFVWVLGAGASLASGIPLGGTLVDSWLQEIYIRESNADIPIEKWATASRLGIVGFTYTERASYYPKIYERRFREYPEEGYAYLEGLMSGKDPSPGYSILAAALAAQPPRHNVVITTNFDNLIADALSIYTDTFPFVCGHESLTAFVRVAMRRPLICKIHRDLLLGPQNDTRSMRRLHDAWGVALRALFQHYTPIFIGYGGNDETLMDLLESLQAGDIKGQLVWCYYEQSKPSDRIINLVQDQKGVLVPVPDFDLLMVLLGERMAISLLDEEIGRRATTRTSTYRNRIQRLDTVRHPSVTKALAATFDRSGGWWAWDQKARLEKDFERRETVFRQGLQHCPRSPEIRHNFAIFMRKRDENEAEKLHKAAHELDPKDPMYTTGLANFLWKYRDDVDEADKLFRSALKQDRKGMLVPYGYFLWEAKNKIDEAEECYQEAVSLDPHDGPTLGAFAHFRWMAQSRLDEAEKLFRASLDADPKNNNTRGNYGGFLLAQGRLTEAREQIKRAAGAHTEDDQLAAELLFYEAVMESAARRDDSTPLNKLKAVLYAGFDRVGWSFDGVLSFVRKKVSKRDYTFFSKIAAGILDPRSMPDLESLLKKRSALKTGRKRKSSSRSTAAKPIQTPIPLQRNGAGESKRHRRRKTPLRQSPSKRRQS